MECIKLLHEKTEEDFSAELSELRTFFVEKPVARQWRIYDTFDWRLFARSLLLCGIGGELVLFSFASGRQAQCGLGESMPTFAWNLPESALRRTLEPILKARALLELVDVNVKETTYRILNADKKTVARVVYSVLRKMPDVSSPTIATYVCVRPVRGYTKHAHRLTKALGSTVDFPQVASLQEAVFYDALATTGKSPNSYSAKLDLALTPNQRADEATKTILRRLLETMRANETGIRDDIDIEYLHDYRVAIRRTRSALSQVRGVFPTETTDRFKQEFRQLGTRTNQLRDLDVYLLAESDYRAILPDALQSDIDPLFDLLRTQRTKALDFVIEGLNAEEYEQILSDWEDFLVKPGSDDPTAPNAAMPIVELARKRIYKRYLRIVEDGAYILDHTEDELLHALRLECKKLRYLLEFFASLFPRKRSIRLIRQLKQLQKNLGDFTDLSVQQESLMVVAAQLPDDDLRTRPALIATGALVETLARRQQEVKANFATTFTRFAAPANQRAYHELFAPKRKKKGKGG